MKIRYIAITLTVLLAATGILFAGSLSSGKTWSFCGPHTLITTASNGELANATQSVHDKLGSYPMQPDGKKSDPSFSAKSSSDDGQNGKFSRVTTSFNDANGSLISIESVERSGQDTIVFFDYAGHGGSLTILNEFTAALQKQGVKNRQ
jgi:hypothetical protein